MMKRFSSKHIITVAIGIVIAVLAGLYFSRNTFSDAEKTAGKVSARLEDRFAKLDFLASTLLDQHPVQWPDLGDVPEDMVLYRYMSDTLNCWYNLFSVKSDDISPLRIVADFSGGRHTITSPLAHACAEPTLVNMGGKWYLIKSYVSGNRKVIAGLMIMGNPSPGNNGINRHLLKSGRYTVTTLNNEGSVVFVSGTPVFKITDGGAPYQGIYSTVLNTDIGKFGTLYDVLFINTVIFLIVLALHFGRKKILTSCEGRRRRSMAIVGACVLAAVWIMWYCLSSISCVVENSSITFEPRRFTSLDWYSLLIYVSFAIVCVAAFLICDLALSVINIAFRKNYTLRKSLPTIICAIIFSFGICTIVTNCEFRKEQKRMAAISDRVVSGLTPRSGNFVPPFFSYAKYKDGKLVDFKGNFAYPLVLSQEYAYRPQNVVQNTILSDGYRHFINFVDDSQLIILSREEMGFISFFVMFSFFAIFLSLLMHIFHVRGARQQGPPRLFSTKIRRLIILSLLSTLVVMTTVSVIFVYQRNERMRRNNLSDKISSVQIMLDSYCTDKANYKELLTPNFSEKLKETAKTTQSSILLYSPSGRMVMSSGMLDFIGPHNYLSRLDPEAFKKIRLEHERYCILEREVSGHRVFVLCAPVVNADGNIIAIACIPNIEKDFNFMRDAVFHGATIISIFALILFIVVLVVTSISNAIFMPLRDMGKKMSAAKPSDLEPIDYKGEDEISALVEAYNKMVMTMRSSTVQLAQAERNKAWSEMARQVAHEIKNPLTPIKLEIQRIIRLKQKGDPSWEEKFTTASEVILEHIDILSQTANEFSTFANLYSEPPVEMELNKLIQDQIFLFEDRGVKITFLGTDEALYSGPKPQLTRVIFNILNNAAQAVEDRESPQILVSLRRGERGLVISIEDNGPGVPDANMDKLFTPNFTTKSGGTGLGLAICRNVVENCGGTIEYSRSFSLGGACFSVFLP